MPCLLYRCVLHVCVFVCMPVCNYNEQIERLEKPSCYVLVHFRGIYILNMQSFALPSCHFFFWSVKRVLNELGKVTRAGRRKAESSLLHVAFYLVKLPPNQSLEVS